MRSRAASRALLITALFALPIAASAQRTPIPRVGRRPAPEPAPLPPAAPGVARVQNYWRSRWSAEGYGLFSAIEVPNGLGGTTQNMVFGTGTHGDYHVSDRMSVTVDLTGATAGSPIVMASAELGTRFSPLSLQQSFESALHPFVDVRASYMYLYDTFAPASGSNAVIGGFGDQFSDVGRYSRGLGAITGVGVEHPISKTIALTTELLGLRNRMTTYRTNGPGTIPTGSTYWMTTFRYTLGLKFSPVRTLRATDKPAS